MEQHAAIRFCFLLSKNASETLEIINQAYSEDTMSCIQIYKWFSRFKKGRTSLEDDSKPGTPTTSIHDENVERVRTLLASDRRLTCKMISAELKISTGSVHTIVHEKLNKRKLYAKLVPHFLTEEQKEQRVNAARDFIEFADSNPDFLNKIITGDESWCFQYDPTTKRQSAEWVGKNSPKPIKSRATKSRVKTMLMTMSSSIILRCA